MNQSLKWITAQDPDKKPRNYRGLIIALVVFVALFVFVCDSLTPETSDVAICSLGTFANTGAQLSFGGFAMWVPIFVWLPDGEQVLYNDLDGNIFKVSAADIEKTLEDAHGFGISINTEGDLFALTTFEPTVDVYTYPYIEKIHSLPAAADSLLSPDGQRLAVLSVKGGRTQIDLFRLNSVGRIFELGRSIKEKYYLNTWSRAGGYLTLNVSSFPDKSVNGLTDKLILLEVTSHKSFPLVNLPGCQMMPTWSPDDRQVIFTANPELWNWNLYQVEIGKDEAKMLTNTPEMDEFQPDWSPDGESIVYVGFKVISDPVSEQELYRLDLSSGDVERLTNTPDEHESYPRWSPDGKKIAYLSFEDDTWYLNVMNPDGSGQERLATIGKDTR